MDIGSANEETRAAWNANAELWDARMADDGNDFANILQWPALQRLMKVADWSGSEAGTVKILDIACGNGLFSRRLASLGALIVACDFSEQLLARARQRTPEALQARMAYLTVDVTDEAGMAESLEPRGPYDFALCNMALFDIANIEPLFGILPRLLKPTGAFIFSLTHPCFNTARSVHVAEEIDDEGEIRTVYSVRLSRYMTPYQARGLALRNQPRPQLYFERPLHYYLNLGFANGFVLDGFEERAFPAGHPQSDPLMWGGNFSEIPAVLVARMRLAPTPPLP